MDHPISRLTDLNNAANTWRKLKRLHAKLESSKEEFYRMSASSGFMESPTGIEDTSIIVRTRKFLDFLFDEIENIEAQFDKLSIELEE